jgi:uncharacterized protein (TIGR02246 family)
MGRRASTVLAGLMLTTLLLMALRVEAADASDMDKAAIQTLFVDFNNALNNHDAHAAAMLFTEDGDFIGIQGKIVHGRADIEQQMAPLFNGILKTMHRDVTLRGVRFLRPDVATVDSDYVTTGVVGANGVPAPATKGLYDWIVTKQDGRWLIAVWHESNLPAPPATAATH